MKLTNASSIIFFELIIACVCSLHASHTQNPFTSSLLPCNAPSAKTDLDNADVLNMSQWTFHNYHDPLNCNAQQTSERLSSSYVRDLKFAHIQPDLFHPYHSKKQPLTLLEFTQQLRLTVVAQQSEQQIFHEVKVDNPLYRWYDLTEKVQKLKSARMTPAEKLDKRAKRREEIMSFLSSNSALLQAMKQFLNIFAKNKIQPSKNNSKDRTKKMVNIINGLAEYLRTPRDEAFIIEPYEIFNIKDFITQEYIIAYGGSPKHEQNRLDNVIKRAYLFNRKGKLSYLNYDEEKTFKQNMAIVKAAACTYFSQTKKMGKVEELFHIDIFQQAQEHASKIPSEAAKADVPSVDTSQPEQCAREIVSEDTDDFFVDDVLMKDDAWIDGLFSQ